MTPERFTDWLQGFVEIADSDTISEKQWLIIKDHLKLVFDKVTPDRSFEIKPNTTIGNPPRLTDLVGIGKDGKWNITDYKFPPGTITC